MIVIYNVAIIFILFFIYSVIGYLVEIISVSRLEKRLVLSRGYLIGPYLPIFGFGAISMIVSLYKYSDDILALFILSVFICCFLEYFTSLFMENIFHLRWWDYSNKKYNIDGRICLENGILFGLGGVIIVKYINPIIMKQIYKIPSQILIIISIILFLIITLDFCLSTFLITKLKIDTNLYINKDATEQIRKQVLHSLEKYRVYHQRFIKAFPYLSKSRRMKPLLEIIEKYKKK